MLPGRLASCANAKTCESTRRECAWREVELLLLALLVFGVYFSRLTDLTIRGEESRWARVAQEMLESGDWIVPRQQGDPFPDRPPLNSWAMILASTVTGQLNLAAIRLPAAIATLLTTLAIYLYGRNFLSRVGAFAAAAAYPTMAQVLQLGRLAESDALLTLCMSAALFGWHYGYARRADPRLAWLAGYAFAALAGMAKGPQGPVYFVAITTIFLSFRRDWPFLFNRWHLAGLAAFALIIGAWQLPFVLALDPTCLQAIWSEGGDIGSRFHYQNLRQVLSQWVSYPFEVFVCTMPWSFMLLVLPTRWFRSTIAEARPLVAFLVTACAVAFPTCWLPADSRARYFMSLYPCVALLVGLGVQRCWESPRLDWWQRSWDRFQLSGAAVILGAGLFLGVVRLWGGAHLHGIGQATSSTFAIVYGLTAVVAAFAVLWSRSRRDRAHVQVGILALAGFMGLSYSGIVINTQMRTSNDPSAAVVSVREMIPPGDRLVSFGPVHHLFAYYYQQPIELRKVDNGQAPTQFTNTYFCFVDDPFFATPEIPFLWDRVAEISCERARSKNPLTKVVVGKRKAPVADARRQHDATGPAPPFSEATAVKPAAFFEDAIREK
jgi:4-amino-4-deoxy-L-arabinose transferase-like glycosyltransferase